MFCINKTFDNLFNTAIQVLIKEIVHCNYFVVENDSPSHLAKNDLENLSTHKKCCCCFLTS